MPSEALVTQGTDIQFTPSGGGAAALITDATGWSGPTFTRNEIDVTNLQSTGKEYRLGLQDPGNMSVDVNWNIWDDPGQAAAWAQLGAIVPGILKITYVNGGALEFDALVSNFEQTGATDDKVSGTLTMRLTGAPRTTAPTLLVASQHAPPPAAVAPPPVAAAAAGRR
jgi:Lambda phage tail tube protein, TTP